MPRVGGVSRSATVAWGGSSAHANLLASGTKAGAISDSFDNTSHLEIFSLDLVSSSKEMPQLGSVQTNERFHRIAWGNAGIADGSLPYGLLAGGMDDGTIKIFNPALMLANADADPTIACVEKHTGAVRGLEFNPTMSHLLASGAGDSEVFITDLTNPASPSIYNPGARPNQSADIACVAWNRKVAHILASTSHSGLSVVWDLKLKRPVINFTDTTKRGQRNSVIAWNPEVATQILVASEDDASPKLQIWDLRNALAPVTELLGHTKGVLTASWCPDDANLLLSAGKDNRTICWDPSRGEVVSEMPASNNWTFDVQWSPCIPAMLASCSFDGEVSVFSLQDFPSVEPAATNGFAVSEPPSSRPARAPKWLQRPCGATFGFGGRICYFSASTKAVVTIADVVTDREVISRSEKLHSSLETQSLSAYCDAKAAATSSERDADEWRLMHVLCSQDRQLLLRYLGLASVEDTRAPSEATAQADDASLGSPVPPAIDAPDEDAAAIFSQLAVATERQESLQSAEAEAAEMSAAVSTVGAESPVEMAPPHDPKLSQAILNGNFEAAVSICMAQGRTADALVLAASGGPELWVATRDGYLASKGSSFMHTLGAIVHQDFGKYVAESSLCSWKETLALINTYASAEEFPGLCSGLAYRLEAESADLRGATICYMCAASVGKAIELWQSHYASANSSKTDSLLDLMEKIVIFQEVAKTKGGYQGGYQLIADKLAEFAELLASQGCLFEAMSYLLQLPSIEPSSAAASLMHRIHGCDGALLAAPPVVPFEYVHVGTAPSEAYPAQESYAQYGQEGYYDGQYDSSYDGYSYPADSSYHYSGTNSYDATSAYPASGGYIQPHAETVQQPQPAPPTPAYYAQPPAAAYAQPPAPVYAQPPAAAANYNYAPPAPAAPTPVQQPPYSYQPSVPQPAPTFPPAQPPSAYDYATPTAAAPVVQPPAAAPALPPAPSYDAQPVIQIVSGLIAKCNAYQLLPIDKRKLDDVEKRIGILVTKLSSGEIAAAVFEKLLRMCQALAAGDARTAGDLQVQIATTDWVDNGHWLMGLKRLIEMTSKLQVTLP